MTEYPAAILGELVPHDDRLWRLEFPGSIIRAAERRTPMVQVGLTPFASRKLSRASLESERNFDKDYITRGFAATSDFGFLRAGSFWINGVPCKAFPPYELRDFVIDVSEATSTLLDAYQPMGKHFLIPPFLRNVPFKHTYFVALKPITSSTTVLIPCTEIFRFYYSGISGKLGTAILDGTYETERWKVVNEKASSWPNKDGSALVRRGPFVNDDDAIDVARLTFSSYAQSQAHFIFASLPSNGDEAGIQARLPYEGRTKLRVRGMEFSGALGRTFLVLVIERCSGPMPFAHLVYERENEPNPEKAEDVRHDARRLGSIKGPVRASDRGSYTQQQDPSQDERSISLRGFLNHWRYDPKPKLEYRRREAKSTGTKGTRRLAESVEKDLSSGTKVGGDVGHPVDYSEDSSAAHNERPEMRDFWNAIKSLKVRQPGVDVQILGLRTFPTDNSSKKKRKRTWCSLRPNKGRPRARRAGVATVSAGQQFHALFEIERGTTKTGTLECFQTVIFTCNLSTSLGDSYINELLSYIAYRRGKISRTPESIAAGDQMMDITGLRHDVDAKDASAWADAMFFALRTLGHSSSLWKR